MVTDEIVEAACISAYGPRYAEDAKSKHPNIWADRLADMRRALVWYENARQSAEALRPKMVEVGVIEDSEYGKGFRLYDFDSLPIGTKLYAEQPKPDAESFIDSFGATTA